MARSVNHLQCLLSCGIGIVQVDEVAYHARQVSPRSMALKPLTLSEPAGHLKVTYSCVVSHAEGINVAILREGLVRAAHEDALAAGGVRATEAEISASVVEMNVGAASEVRGGERRRSAALPDDEIGQIGFVDVRGDVSAVVSSCAAASIDEHTPGRE